MINKISNEDLLKTAQSLRWEIGDDLHDNLINSLYADAGKITDKVVIQSGKKQRFSWERTLDKVLTSPISGFPVMLLILTAVFWITIEGANYPSGLLAEFLIDFLHPVIKSFFVLIGSPGWLTGLLVDGIYLASAWVIAVMLPPMAIFFPIFTLLEDFGYLPRIAFNLDNMFRKSGAHGKQALTMSMGYGCNVAGIIATRIIDSPRERLIAIITNNFALCNGRWPTQILIASLFIGAVAPPGMAGFVSAMAVVGIALLGIFFTFLVSWALSKTILKGEASTFSLELPPYRPPQFWRTIYTSIIDRTIIVLWRAVMFAMPAGAVIWLLANISIGDLSLAEHSINFLDSFGWLIGLNGVILLAYIIAIPANEIVIPVILMLTVLSLNIAGMGDGTGVMFELTDNNAYTSLFNQANWTLLTAVNLMLFSLLHNPCSTAIYTIYKETRSAKWTWFSALMPVAVGFIVTFLVAQIWRIFG